MRKQLFLSHTWTRDEDGRDTHERVRTLAAKLRGLGWTVWFDETDMQGNVDACMAAGIDDADAIILCLTREYARKVNRNARIDGRQSNDNCYKEFSYACTRSKVLVPVVFERAMRSTGTWSPGVLCMRLSSELYVDATDDLDAAATTLTTRLRAFGVTPKRPPLHRFDSERLPMLHTHRRRKLLPRQVITL